MFQRALNNGSWKRYILNLGFGKIVLSGESGGGNLCLTLALKAKRDGKLEGINSVYAFCPCISGMYVEQPEDLMSLINGVRGYRGVSARGMSLMARLYDPEFAHRANPLAWPLDL